MKPRHRRLIAIVAGLAVFGVAVGLVLYAMRGNLVFFFSPTDVAQHKAPVDRTFRLGGLVVDGSLKRMPDGLTVKFVVTDTGKSIPVTYHGILPDLFKEGRGVIAQGKLGPDGVFRATEVLAKHDENYMPPEAAKAIAKAHAASGGPTASAGGAPK